MQRFFSITKNYTKYKKKEKKKEYWTKRTSSQLNWMAQQLAWKDQPLYCPSTCFCLLVRSTCPQSFASHARAHNSPTPLVPLGSLKFDIFVSAITKRARAISCLYIINHTLWGSTFYENWWWVITELCGHATVMIRPGPYLHPNILFLQNLCVPCQNYTSSLFLRWEKLMLVYTVFVVSSCFLIITCYIHEAPGPENWMSTVKFVLNTIFHFAFVLQYARRFRTEVRNTCDHKFSGPTKTWLAPVNLNWNSVPAPNPLPTPLVPCIQFASSMHLPWLNSYMCSTLHLNFGRNSSRAPLKIFPWILTSTQFCV